MADYAHEDVKMVRGYTQRIREALKDLPATIREEGFNVSSDKEELRGLLQEITGSVAAIAEICEVEL